MVSELIRNGNVFQQRGVNSTATSDRNLYLQGLYIYIYIYIYKQTNYQKKKYDKAKRVLIVRSKGQN
jgi:hypothetical protein